MYPTRRVGVRAPRIIRPGRASEKGFQNLTEDLCYWHTRTELTNNWFHTFPLSTFIFI